MTALTTALIVGLGSSGRRHLGLLRSLRPDLRMIALRHTRSDSPHPDIHAEAHDLQGAIDHKPDFALICNPASLHLETGMALARAGIDLFIEKPIAASLPGVDALLRICQTNGVLLTVGYVLRYSASLRKFRQAIGDGMIGRVLSFRAEVGQSLPDWRPDQDYRDSVSANADLGGGALLELSHEIDYVRWIFGDIRRVSAMAHNSGHLDIDVEDLVESSVSLTSPSGDRVIGSIHLDMLQTVVTRTCTAIGTTAICSGTASPIQSRCRPPMATRRFCSTALIVQTPTGPNSPSFWIHMSGGHHPWSAAMTPLGCCRL